MPPPEPKKGESGQFMAARADAASAKPKKGESGQFLAAAAPAEPQAAAAAAPPPSGAAADAVAAAAGAGGPNPYPGDDAPKEQLAAWLGREAEKRGLPKELPVMASLVESGVKNLNFGDADSVGFFQMRVGIWNQGEYAGFPEKPELQAKWFLDTAERVKEQRMSRGQSVTDPNQFGTGSPTSSAPPSSTAAATSSASTRRAGCSPRPATRRPRRPRRPPPSSRPPLLPHPPLAAAVEVAGGGGGGDAAAKALLANTNIGLDADAQKDVRDGAVDPRLVALLTKLSEKHKIDLSVIKTGHAQFSAGGGVSNHFEGRGIDIARVDGEIVRPNSAAARELATEIAALQGDIRPTEVGTPWAISESGFFTDGAHQDHLHVAFDDPPPEGFQAPAAAAPAAPAAVAAAAPAAPGAPVAAAAAVPQPPKKGESGQFMAAAAKAADAAGRGRARRACSWPPSRPRGRRARSRPPRRSRAWSTPLRQPRRAAAAAASASRR